MRAAFGRAWKNGKCNNLDLCRCQNSMKAFQDYYPEDLSHCYGCGNQNEHGHKLKTYWDGEETVSCITPEPKYMAIPGYVYGGFVASIIDCHGTGSAAAAAYREADRPMDSLPPFRFVTGSLKVSYKRPTPMGVELEIRGRIEEIKGRKVVVSAKVLANGEVCAIGEVVAVQMPANMLK